MSQILVTGEAKIRDIQGPVVANSGVITALDGAASQYVRGDGTLADFPTSTGGGSSVSYYLNSSVSQGTIGGVAYRELSKDAITGAGTDITISANGYVASYITDANDPSLLEVPSGNFNCEFYFSVNSDAHNPYVYAELYKYDGATFTLLGSSQAVPEYLTSGTTIAPYYFAIPVATAALAVTDRIAIRIYVNVDGRTVTLHTENNHLCQVVTTFSKGMISLNNLTKQNQYLATGTSGTNFNIVSSTDTHTFNLPVASATNTGKLSNTDWSTFNAKQPAGNYATLDTTQTITALKTFTDTITFTNYALMDIGVSLAKTSGTPLYGGLNSYANLQLVNAGSVNSLYLIDGDTSKYSKLSFNNAADYTYTFPNITGTLALLEGTQTFSGLKSFSLGISAVGGIGFPETIGGSNYGGISGSSSFFQIAAQNGSVILIKSSNNTNAITISTVGKVDFGSTIGNGTYTYTLPSATGTLALTSDLSSYLPLTGGTLTGGLNGTTATFSGLGTFYQLTMTGATAGRLFYAQTGGVFSQSGNLVWDNTTEMLGVGTPNPSAVVTAFSTNAATQLKAAGTAPAITFSNTLTSASLACVFGLATANNHFVTGTAAGDMAIANQSTSPGAIIFGTGTFEKMRMTASGNLSIGNTNDTYKLDVNGTGRFSDSVYVNDNKIFGLRTSTNEYSIQYRDLDFRLIGSSDSSTQRLFSFGYYTSNNVAGTWNQKASINSYTGAATFSSSVTANSTSGISGTFTSNTFFGSIDLENTGGTATGKWNVQAVSGAQIGGSAGSSFGIYSYGASAYRLFINSSGNVGIGTSSPAVTLHALGKIRSQDNRGGSYAAVEIYGGDSSSFPYISVDQSNPLTFITGGSERMRITSGGNVGIGTSSPSGDRVLQLHNPNFAYARFGLTNNATGTSGTDGLIVQMETNTAIIKNQENDTLRLGTNSSETQLVLHPTGNVSIGTTTDNGNKLQVSGNTYSEGLYVATGQFSQGASATTTFYTFSNISSNRVFLITLRQAGGTANNVVAMGFTYAGVLSAYNIIQDNTNPALYLTITSTGGLGLRLTTGSGYSTTTWDYTITQIK